MVVLAALGAAALPGCLEPNVSFAPGPAPPQAGWKVVSAYYMHRTFRCLSCLLMEKMAREAVQEEFAAELALGRVRWSALNYDAHEGLAERYGLGISSLVLVVHQDGKETGHEVLDDLWSLKPRPDAFRARVIQAVRAHLAAAR